MYDQMRDDVVESIQKSDEIKVIANEYINVVLNYGAKLFGSAANGNM